MLKLRATASFGIYHKILAWIFWEAVNEIMTKYFKHNALSLAFLFLFLLSLVAEAFCGFKVYNGNRVEEALDTVTMGSYLRSGHFIQAWRFLCCFLFS